MNKKEKIQSTIIICVVIAVLSPLVYVVVDSVKDTVNRAEVKETRKMITGLFTEMTCTELKQHYEKQNEYADLPYEQGRFGTAKEIYHAKNCTAETGYLNDDHERCVTAFLRIKPHGYECYEYLFPRDGNHIYFPSNWSYTNLSTGKTFAVTEYLNNQPQDGFKFGNPKLTGEIDDDLVVDNIIKRGFAFKGTPEIMIDDCYYESGLINIEYKQVPIGEVYLQKYFFSEEEMLKGRCIVSGYPNE